MLCCSRKEVTVVYAFESLDEFRASNSGSSGDESKDDAKIVLRDEI